MVIKLNEQDQKILELYLQDIKKKRITLFVIIALFLFVCTTISGMYVKNNRQMDVIDNEVDLQDNSNQNSLNEIDNNTIIDSNSQVISENTNTVEENIQNNENTIVEEPQKQNNTETVKENTEKETQTNKPKTSETKQQETAKQKPANKDFLFTDGYNMENVSQAAESYLKSSGYAGECIPLKDGEGIYIGMRVIFH